MAIQGERRLPMVALRMPRELYRRAGEYGRRRRLSTSAVIRLALQTFLEREERSQDLKPGAFFVRVSRKLSTGERIEQWLNLSRVLVLRPTERGTQVLMESGLDFLVDETPEGILAAGPSGES